MKLQQTQKQSSFWSGENGSKQDDNEEGVNKKTIYKSLKLWVWYLTKKLPAQQCDFVRTLKHPEQFPLPKKKKKIELELCLPLSSLHNTQSIHDEGNNKNPFNKK